MGEIKIRGLEISACHGVNAEEKVNKQPFVFDADIAFDFYGAAEKDDLNLTVNYSKACKLIASVTQNNSFDLIETLAYSCANALIGEFNAEKVTLTVWKPQAPVKLKFENLGVTVGVERVISYLSLGSSQGDRKGYIEKALNLLD
ncbi:MAG: dihydroneopterin aldolase, partial [Clostridia bacterium]|nr:dihydroneopterin aldolase [Clostridia bacterium]